MRASQLRKIFILILRLYPLLIGALLLLGFLLGDFSERSDPILAQDTYYAILKIVLGVVPISAMVAFLLIGNASDRAFRRNNENQETFEFEDAFTLPDEKMHGYKLARIVGREPIFMGLTGDTYSADDSSHCGIYPDHVPPVKGCQCGFHAFKDLDEAIFERSIYRTAFLFDVDLYGLGFVYQRGYRAETQVINHMIAPKRCMLCKTLPAKKFVTKYEFNDSQPGIWSWQIRCRVCSGFYKPADTLSFDQMAHKLEIKII
jgi:hypothetical protein